MRHLLEQSRRKWGRPQTIKFVLVINYFVPTMYKICFLFLYQISYFNVRCRINLRWNRGEKKGRRKLIYKKTHQIVWTPWNIYMYAMCKTRMVVAKYGRGGNSYLSTLFRTLTSNFWFNTSIIIYLFAKE